MKLSIVAVMVVSIMCPSVYAGVGIDIKCSDEKCGFKSEFLMGTGKRSTIMSRANKEGLQFWTRSKTNSRHRFERFSSFLNEV